LFEPAAGAAGYPHPPWHMPWPMKTPGCSRSRLERQPRDYDRGSNTAGSNGSPAILRSRLEYGRLERPTFRAA